MILFSRIDLNVALQAPLCSEEIISPSLVALVGASEFLAKISYLSHCLFQSVVGFQQVASGKISFHFYFLFFIFCSGIWERGGEVAYNEGSGTGRLDSDFSAVLLASAWLTLQLLACLVPGCSC